MKILYIAIGLFAFIAAASAQQSQTIQHVPTLAEWPGIANEIMLQKNTLQNRTIELAQENAALKAEIETMKAEVTALKTKEAPAPAK